MKNVNIKTILKNYLKEKNFDGFINLETGCFCEKENLMSKCPNKFDILNCVPGRIQNREDCNIVECVYWGLTRHCYCIQPVFGEKYAYIIKKEGDK